MPLSQNRPGNHPAGHARRIDRAVQGLAGAIDVRDYVPTSALVPERSVTPLVWIHGGGFSSGGLDHPESDAVAARLAVGRLVRTVAYRLVPPIPTGAVFAPLPTENQYPAALDDVVDAILDLADGKGQVVIGGASAGACLAVAAALRLRQGPATSLLEVSALVLVYGTFHAVLPPIPVDLSLRLDGPIAGAVEMVRRMNLNYVRDEEALTDPLALPGGSELRGLPPTLIIDADRDVLRASGSALAEELTRAGVPLGYEVVAGTQHGFLGRPDSEGFELATARMVGWLAERDGQSRRPDLRNVSDGRSPNRRW